MVTRLRYESSQRSQRNQMDRQKQNAKSHERLEVAVNPLCSACALLSCMHQRMCPNPAAAVRPIQPRPDPTLRTNVKHRARVEADQQRISTAPSRYRDIRQVVQVRTGQAGKPCLPCFPAAAAAAAAIANGYQTCTRIRSAASPISQTQGFLLTDVQPRAGTDFRVPYHGQSLFRPRPPAPLSSFDRSARSRAQAQDGRLDLDSIYTLSREEVHYDCACEHGC